VPREADRGKDAQGSEEWLLPASPHRGRQTAEWASVKARRDLAMDERDA
jgi:hypothetical protein